MNIGFRSISFCIKFFAAPMVLDVAGRLGMLALATLRIPDNPFASLLSAVLIPVFWLFLAMVAVAAIC